MGSLVPNTLLLFTQEKVDRRIPRRIGIALILTLLLHLLFFFGIAPYLRFITEPPHQTEVQQITPEQLAQLKEKIMKNKFLNPLLNQELHEEFRSKERPKEADYMGAFNQTVPKQKIAGPQHDEPLAGGGGRKGTKTKIKTKTESLEKPMQEPLKLEEIGLGKKLPPPPKAQDLSRNNGPQGQLGPHRPVGRLNTRLEQGDENLLNAVENEYYSFFARFEEPIIRNWFFLIRSQEMLIHQELMNKKIEAGAELPTTIEVILDRQGNISAKIVESSGVPALDYAARDAVLKLRSFPNPPAGLFGSDLYFVHHLRFMVSISSTPFIQPGLRWY